MGPGRGIGLALAVGGALTGCAAVSAGPSGPVVSPTGIVYEPGTPPRQTRFSQTATLYLSQGESERALNQAREGVEADPGNPIHYFLAGLALAALGAYEEADEMWREAQRIYPAYELEIEPERERHWAALFNAGLEAYGADDSSETIGAWERATVIYDLRPEAHRNLAILLAERGEYEEAIRAYQRGLAGLTKQPASRLLDDPEVRDRAEAQRVMEENLVQLLLFTDRFAEAEPHLRRQLQRDSTDVQARRRLAAALSGQGRDGEATPILKSLLAGPGLSSGDLLGIGVALFRSGEFMAAAGAFGRVTDLQPHGRDAWFNHANALFAAEAWDVLAPVGERLMELDPLNENAALITARAHLESGDEEAALRTMERNDGAPVHVDELQMLPSPAETTVRGRVIGNTAEAGAEVRLLFTFYDDARLLGTETLTLAAPAPEASTPFRVTFSRPASAFRYALLP